MPAALPSDEKLAPLWEEYRQTGDIGLRNELVVHYLPVVNGLVQLFLREYPYACSERDDLVATGRASLIESVEWFDPHAGVPFRHAVRSRIRGAFWDWIRWVLKYQRRELSLPRPELYPTYHINPALLNMDLLDCLEQREQLIIRWRHEYKYSWKQIGELAGCHPNYARRLRMHAVQKLRRIYH